MGQILSWIRGPSRDVPALRDVSVEQQQSQSGEAAPKPAAPVSHFEQKASAGSNMASKPAAGTTAATGSVATGTAASKSAAAAQVKTSSAAPSAPVSKPSEHPKDKTSTAPTTVKAAEAKVDPGKTSKPAAATASAAATEAKTAKVQVEVPASKVTKSKQAAPASPAVDPLDALASSLPSEAPSRPEPKYTGPEVKEQDVTSEKGVRVGERDDTLPPGYRLKDMPPVPADVKPKDVPKPLSTDDALDLLSSGFSSEPKPKDKTPAAVPPVDKKPKMHSAPKAQDTGKPLLKVSEKDICHFPARQPMPKYEPEPVLIRSGDVSDSSAPAPAAPSSAPSQKVQPGPVSPAPPVDKKARMETDEFSLEAGLAPSTAQKVESKKPAAAKDTTDSKPKPETPDPMSLDALEALGGMLPTAESKPESPTLRPEDIVSEGKVTKEKGVRVGEREDTIPPEYRFKEEDICKLPAPEPQPTLDTSKALDILSGDFSDPSSAPVQQAPVPPAQSKVETLSALDALSEDFVAPTKAGGVHASAPATAKTTQKVAAAVSPAKKPAAAKAMDSAPKPDQGDSMSLDALSALGDTLAAAEPKPEPPKVRPEDIVPEATVTEEKGVRVGEREDTIPPEYRFKEEDICKLPAPESEPTLDTSDAFDILSGDFSAPSSAPSTQAAADAALDALSGDFVASSAAPTVQSSACPPTEASVPLTPGADSALDALSDSLKDITPTPQPEPPLPTNIVKEKQIEEERLIKMGERDDTLPPEYRPTKEDLKKMAEEKNKVPESPKNLMDEKTALDLLSGDFSAPAAPAAPAPASASFSCTSSTQVQVQAPPTDSHKPMPGPVLDTLSETLLPDKPEFKSKTDKSKKPQTEGPAELPSSQLSSDLVPSSTKKGGKS